MQDHKSFCELPILATELESRACSSSKSWGYERLIKTILEKQLPFSKYDGLELSSERVERLRRKLTDPRINFIQGDVMKSTYNAQYNLVLCSATFEHLFPDFSIALSNIARHLVKNAYLFIDFIMEDDNLSIEFANFEKMGDAFVRIYSKNCSSRFLRDK
jgi:hypothetical protein